MVNSDMVSAVGPIVEFLQDNYIPYYISGSVAESLYGISRATRDVDIAVSFVTDHADRMVRSLKDRYYIDLGMIERAVLQKSSFNLIHLETMFKIDFFVLKDGNRFTCEVMQRRVQEMLDLSAQLKVIFASAEDVILHKLQ